MKKIILLMLSLCLVLCASCGLNRDTDEAVNTEPSTIEEVEPVSQPKEDEDVVLYYSDNMGTGLYKETRTLSYDDAHNPEVVLKELFKGTTNSNLTNVLPSDITINSCSIKDGICIVDLSVEFIEIQGTAAQEMAMYSIVNTLCEMEEVQKVQFLIDGEKEELLGYFDIASPCEPNMDIVAD